jgi:hypothetical protein
MLTVIPELLLKGLTRSRYDANVRVVYLHLLLDSLSAGRLMTHSAV